MKTVLLLALLCLSGCCKSDWDTSNGRKVILLSNPSIGATVFHNGKWWKVVRISYNDERRGFGRSVVFNYVEIEMCPSLTQESHD